MRISDWSSDVCSSDLLAGFAGLKDEIAAITTRSMNGEIDFSTALRERVAMIAGLPEDALERTLAGIRLNPGARVLVTTMRAHGAFTALVSGGFRWFTSRIAAEIGFDHDEANDLLVADGKVTGKLGEPILGREGKLAALGRLAAARGATAAEAVAVGRSEEHTSELQSLMRISYAVFCLKKKKHYQTVMWCLLRN